MRHLGHLREGTSCLLKHVRLLDAAQDWRKLPRTGGSSPEAGLARIFQEPIPPELPQAEESGYRHTCVHCRLQHPGHRAQPETPEIVTKNSSHQVPSLTEGTLGAANSDQGQSEVQGDPVPWRETLLYSWKCKGSGDHTWGHSPTLWELSTQFSSGTNAPVIKGTGCWGQGGGTGESVGPTTRCLSEKSLPSTSHRGDAGLKTELLGTLRGDPLDGPALSGTKGRTKMARRSQLAHPFPRDQQPAGSENGPSCLGDCQNPL